MKQESNYSLLQHNTFGIDAHCRQYLRLDSVAEAVSELPKVEGDFIIVGEGSNLLLTKDFDGTVITSGIMGIEPFRSGQDVMLRCGSGENWDGVVDYCVRNGIHDAENLSLIPGTVGASVVQNIGAYGAEIKDIVQSIEAVEIATGKTVQFAAADCRYGYRQSRFKTDWKNRYFVTYVTYRLSLSFSPMMDYGNITGALDRKGISYPTAKELRDTIIEIRREKLPDPKVLGNAGSFFMNPIVPRSQFEALLEQYPDMPHYYIDKDREKIPAGWMIDKCGWKGRSLGPAGVHDKQALVLVNRGGATGHDVVELCKAIQKDVKEKFGIDIHPEVNII